MFPSVVALGGTLECRSNWQIYVEELAIALSCFTGERPQVTCFQADTPLTPFEKKYRDSGQALYRLRTILPDTRS